jgi:activator of HSP90 ATPase
MEFTVADTFNCSPDRLYEAWLDSEDHSDMTGGDALITDEVDDPFTTWDGYIWGRTLALKRNEYIKQSWKTEEFEEDQDFSTIEVFFSSEGDKTKVTIKHSGLTDKDVQYEKGWIDNYFKPMHAYFD